MRRHRDPHDDPPAKRRPEYAIDPLSQVDCSCRDGASGSNLTLGARYAIHVGDALVKILLMAAILGVWP
jgi:hypothetical protein